MDEVVKKNIKIMLSHDVGGMGHLLMQESFGGNAGQWRNKPCAGTRFFYDAETGEIKYFGNVQHVPEDIKERFTESIFRVADYGFGSKNPRFRIIQHWIPDELPHDVKRNLEASVIIYNQTNGFNLRKKIS